MNSDNRLIAKNTLFLYVRTIVVMLITLYTSRVVLKSLGVVDYGIYNVVGGLISIMSFINGAMSASTVRYLTFELGRRDYNRLNIVFCTCIQIHFVIAIFVLLLAETVGLWFFYNEMTIPPERMNSAFVVYQLSVLTGMIGIMNIPYNTLLIAHERMSSFAYITIIDASLKLLVAVSLSLFLFDKLIIYALLMCLVYIFVISIYWRYCKNNFSESKYSFIIDKPLVAEMSKYAFWSLFSNFAFVTYTQGVNILLNIFFGPAVNAARGITVQVQAAVSRFTQGFQSALNPQITKSYAANDRNRLVFLIDTSSRYSFFLVLILSFPILAELDNILHLWLGEVPKHTANFIRITLLSMPIGVLLNPLNIATQATGRIKRFAFVTGFVQIFILPISYIVLKLGGAPESVYAVYLVMTYLNSIVYIYLTCKEVEISMWNYYKRVVARSFAVAFLASILSIGYYFFFYTSSALLSSILNMIIAILSVLVSIYLIGMSKSEKQFVFGYIRRIFRISKYEDYI